MTVPRPFPYAGRALALCWRAGWMLALCCLTVTVLSGLLPTATAWLTKLVVDAIAGQQRPSAVVARAAALAVVGVAVALAPPVIGHLTTELGRRMDLLMQDRLYTTVNGFAGLSRFENPDLLNRMRMATQVTGGTLAPATTGTFGIGRGVVTLITMTLTLYVMSPVMAGLVLVAAVPSLVARLAMSRSRIRAVAGMSGLVRRQLFFSSLIVDVRAAKEVRLFGLGGFLKSRVLGDVVTVQRDERRLDRRELAVQGCLALLGAGIAGLGLVWAAGRASTGTLSLGDVTAFVAALGGTQGALAGVIDGIASAHQALLSFRYHADLTSLPDDLPGDPRAELPELRHGIELDDVWFRYDDDHPWVLRGLTLTIRSGRSLALVGLNGAGKSTLVKLLCRFYDPTRGSIRWDGVEIRDVPPAELRRRMGVLFQDFMAYDLTAAENIGVGDLPALHDRARIVTAARDAEVHEIVEGLPAGYDTMLSRTLVNPTGSDAGQAGVVLSGGQWQRLAFARTLMRDGRDLLILDEPSAGLDARAEHELHRRLRAHRGRRTSLLVSHRLSAVRDADLIVVLEHGRIAEQGTHDTLMAAGGRYANLFRLQASGYQYAG